MNLLNIPVPEQAVEGGPGGAWSDLGSSFEGKDQHFVFTLGINPSPGFAGKDVILEPEVLESDRKLRKQIRPQSPPIFGDVPDPPPTNSRDAAIERLTSLYQDSEFGPEYFRQNARLIRHLLPVYKTCKNNPNLGMFFHKNSKTGIHIHFNSVSKKRQLVIPVGFPDIKPVWVDIGKVKSWYKAQRRKAITARLKAQLEIMELKLALSKVKNAMNTASISLDLVRGRFEGYLENCLRRDRGSVEEGAASLATYCWDPRAEEIRTRKSELSLKTDELAKLQAEQGMYEEKDFLTLMLDGSKTVTEKYISLSQLITEVYDGLVKCDKQTKKKGTKTGGHYLRSRTTGGKLKKNVVLITKSRK